MRLLVVILDANKGVVFKKLELLANTEVKHSKQKLLF